MYGYGQGAAYRQAAPGYGAPQNQGPPPGQYGSPGYGAPPGGQQMGYRPPPPQQQGPPGQQMGYRPPPPQGPPGQQMGYHPPPQGPPPGVAQDVYQMFQAVDQDRSGQITVEELQRALMNGNWSPFNQETCRLMIGMFDKDRNGTIDVGEFSALWRYIQDWKKCFDQFDRDRSGNIDGAELALALKTFGYNLTDQFSHSIIQVFDKTSSRSIGFDDFIQACVMLKSLTDKFRVKDTSQNGVIRISYEEFLEMTLDNTI